MVEAHGRNGCGGIELAKALSKPRGRGSPRAGTRAPASRGSSPDRSHEAGPTITPTRLERYLRRFSSGNVLVLGDLMLDRYIWGATTRLSPEAPVPVLHVERESLQPGGAANVYNNILSLGGQALLCGVIGADDAGQALIGALRLHQHHRPGILVDPTRPTTQKTRVVAHRQHVVRYDIEQCHDVPHTCTRSMMRYIETHLQSLSCIVVSDYCKGVITSSLMAGLAPLARTHRVPVLVDPKVAHMPYYQGVTIITPNHLEAEQAAGRTARDDASIHDIGHHLRTQLGCDAVLVTRGEQGISLCEATGQSWHIRARAREVYDVTGAGDTLVGTLALAISAGASIRESAMIANHAAGVAVGMLGTAAITIMQLREAMRRDRY